ncbi:AcnD-accessory protein PrpF [Caballeronia catudaia]|uniref:AcnD-accessory protein PrpF n=1 Tax=Caballeronia catudaia TaxID=1777136 RepID=A0A158DEQ3_9BURK|nr:PrpF domain-containing protein [Caballeronia catudaia]SAK92900.1 AcnD-accessory protein PrpF [Caballeronia catudaia]
MLINESSSTRDNAVVLGEGCRAEGESIKDDGVIATRATWYRGGTSKALFVLRSDLPQEATDDLDSWIRAVFGSPDRRQIDGIGGADLVTSKFALIGPSTHPDADVDYSFFQVGIDSNIVATDLNCGNISAAVAPFAIESGLVKPTEGQQTVTIHNTNDGTLFYVTLNVKDGRVITTGDFRCDGVPGTGAPVRLDFKATAGGRTGKLLPTGNLRDTFDVPGFGPIEASVVDIANLIVFARASSFGLKGNEDPIAIQSDTKLMAAVEHLRGAVAQRLGFVEDVKDSIWKSPGTPFVSLVSEAQDWVTFDERTTRSADTCDFMARGFTMQLAHKAYWATGSVCTGVAAALSGSIVNEVASSQSLKNGIFRIAHPVGTIDVEIEVSRDPHGGNYTVNKAQLLRTARKLMEGTVFASRERLV